VEQPDRKVIKQRGRRQTDQGAISEDTPARIVSRNVMERIERTTRKEKQKVSLVSAGTKGRKKKELDSRPRDLLEKMAGHACEGETRIKNGEREENNAGAAWVA
jgi:hypothetical protein